MQAARTVSQACEDSTVTRCHSSPSSRASIEPCVGCAHRLPRHENRCTQRTRTVQHLLMALTHPPAGPCQYGRWQAGNSAVPAPTLAQDLHQQVSWGSQRFPVRRPLLLRCTLVLRAHAERTSSLLPKCHASSLQSACSLRSRQSSPCESGWCAPAMNGSCDDTKLMTDAAP